MPITYPLSLPTSIGIAEIVLSAESAVQLTQSPFTFKQQVYQYPGQRWRASITIPPVQKDLAEEWVTFLLKLNGQQGTFLLSDPNNKTPRGVATGNPLVVGAGQTGNAFNIDGATSSVTGWLKAGDYIQLGTGATSRLYKVLNDVTTDGSGAATIDIWPSLRSSPADNAVVTVSNCVGLFRLAANVSSWTINNISSYGIQFEAIEAL